VNACCAGGKTAPSGSVTASSIIEQLQRAQKDKRVVAVVLRHVACALIWLYALH
jgi:hypothetical protein